MDVLKACKNYFNPQKLVEQSQAKGGWKTVKAGLVISSYFFIIPPLVMGLLYGGAKAVKSIRDDDPVSRKTSNVRQQIFNQTNETEAENQFNIFKNGLVKIHQIKTTANIDALTIEKLTDHFKNNFSGLNDDEINFCLSLAFSLSSNPTASAFAFKVPGVKQLNDDGEKFMLFLDAVIDFASKADSSDPRFTRVKDAKWVNVFHNHREFMENLRS